ncbi:hypothetical protein GW17_00060247 [Ensete ventricosum]|nr:hypothetical protein GW17_00060247 [Ensete ventricosum]
MSQECSIPINPGEDAPPTTQLTSGGAYRPSLSLPSFGDGNIPSHTQGRYWSLLNDPRLTPPPPNPRTPVVTPEAFQGLTNQVQAIAGMLQAIIPYIPQLAQQPSSRPPATPLLQTRTTLPLNEPSSMTPSADNPPHFSLESDQAPLGDATKQPKPVPSFHRDYRHDTEECYDLKNQIEDLIHHGHLDRYVRKPHEPSLHPKGLVEHHIYVIVGGPAASGISSSTRKTYAYPKVQKRP